MKRRLLLVRHAKSAWDVPNLADVLRPLAPRGLRDAPRIGRALAQRDLVPHLALVSSSVRTTQTWGCIASTLERFVEYENVPALYHAEEPALRHLIATVPRWVGDLALVGHNPGLESLASSLAGGEVRVTTANVVVFAAEGRTWSDWLTQHGARPPVVHLRPRALDATSAVEP
jgi:phosphohistidine phosphatase